MNWVSTESSAVIAGAVVTKAMVQQKYFARVNTTAAFIVQPNPSNTGLFQIKMPANIFRKFIKLK